MLRQERVACLSQNFAHLTRGNLREALQEVSYRFTSGEAVKEGRHKHTRPRKDGRTGHHVRID